MKFMLNRNKTARHTFAQYLKEMTSFLTTGLKVEYFLRVRLVLYA